MRILRTPRPKSAGDLALSSIDEHDSFNYCNLTAATSMEREAGERAGDVEEVVEEEELSPSPPPPQSLTPLKQA